MRAFSSAMVSPTREVAQAAAVRQRLDAEVSLRSGISDEGLPLRDHDLRNGLGRFEKGALPIHTLESDHMAVFTQSDQSLRVAGFLDHPDNFLRGFGADFVPLAFGDKDRPSHGIQFQSKKAVRRLSIGSKTKESSSRRIGVDLQDLFPGFLAQRNQLDRTPGFIHCDIGGDSSDRRESNNPPRLQECDALVSYGFETEQIPGLA